MSILLMFDDEFFPGFPFGEEEMIFEDGQLMVFEDEQQMIFED